MSIFVQGNMPPCDSKACSKKKKKKNLEKLCTVSTTAKEKKCLEMGVAILMEMKCI